MKVTISPEQLRQLGDIHRNPPRLILAEVLCCRGVASATRFHYCLDFRPFVLPLKATCSNWRMTLAA
jgi:hypothetical protein